MAEQSKFTIPKGKIAEIPGLTYRSPYTFSLKRRIALALLPPPMATAIKAITATCRVEVRGAQHLQNVLDAAGCVIIAIWHEALALGVSQYTNSGAHALTSYSFDGELAARVIRRFGVLSLRGSSSRGGADALHDMAEALKHVPVVGFTPDGPRGPRRAAKAGIAILSARTGVPIVPYALAASRAWRLPSWDRFQIPKPFARILSAYGAPIPPPQDNSEHTIETTRHAVEKSLADLQAALEKEAAEIKRRFGS